MAASSVRAAAALGAPLATLAPSRLAAAWALLLLRTNPLTRGAAGFSSTAASSVAAAGGGGGGGAADAFTAALQQKTEEELRQLALKQAQPHAADGAETAAGDGQQPDAQSPHGKQEIGGYKGPEPTRYSRDGASDWEIKGRCTDF